MPGLPARLVKYVNWAIGLLVLAILGLGYWYAGRPLPKRSGSVKAPIAAAASVSFDGLGVPHIRAASQDDAFFLQGYVTAQDRLFQMDLFRRFTAGELSEVFGAIAFESDRDARRLRLRRIAEEAYTTLSPSDRAAFAAYARGVNHYISTHLGNLPLEFTILRYQPRPWSVIDGLLMCLNMFRDLTTTWRDEILKREMMAAGDPAKVRALFPVRSGSGEHAGSNAWALAGSRTASGKPLLSNDMHLEYRLPGIWYMTHLEAPGLNVAGVALPGAPGIIVGHNQRIAWGLTNLHFDVQDLYIEKFDEQTGRYQVGDRMEQARPERELIRIRDKPPAEITLWMTRHGPVTVVEGGDRMALRWVAAQARVVEYPILDINRAQNWQQFLAALSRFPGPGQNFVYADVDGNIGYHAAGKLPKRRGYSGDLPVNGASDAYDWDNFIPFDQLPSLFNPADGLIVSANQDPFPADFPYPVNGNFAPPYRAQQIRKLLLSRRGWRAEELLSVQTDIYSSFHQFLAREVVAAYEKRGQRAPNLDSAAALLREWNGQMNKDLAAPFLITLVYQHIRSAVAEQAAPGKGQRYEFTLAPVAIESLLRKRPTGWFRDYDEILLRALIDAVEEGTRIQGRDIAAWRYGNYLRVRIDNQVLHGVLQKVPVLQYLRILPFAGKYFDVDIGLVPMSGASTTIKQTTFRLAPSMRLNADLDDWDHGLLNIAIGQTGQVLSRHYRDQWDAHYNGRSFPMQFNRVDAKSTLTFQPESQ